jgi:parallel beta-helix repeat protein
MIAGRSSGARLDHNSSASDGFSGVTMFDPHDGRIDHNSVTGARGFSIPVFGSTRIRVTHNVLDGNRHGIALLEDSNDNEIESNRISHSAGSSLDFEGSGNRIERNVVSDGGDGILGGGVHNLVADNSVTRIRFFGASDVAGFGLIIDGGHDDLVRRNSVTDTRGQAIYVARCDSPVGADHTVVPRNVTSSRLDDGIHVDAGATATLLRGNMANGSGDDGIDVDSAATTLTGNSANDNFDLGLEAVPDVIDGGGNRASGSGNPLQCTNLACS